MKSLLIALFCVFLINSCGKETNPYEYKSCDLSYILRREASGMIYERGINATNDWFTYYKGIKVSETIFGLDLFPNPIVNNCLTNFSINKDSRVKIFLNDSLLIDNFFMSGNHSYMFDFSTKADGCYKLRAECYYRATNNNNKSDTILTSTGTVLIDKAGKFISTN
jgi:hypothetical protein